MVFDNIALLEISSLRVRVGVRLTKCSKSKLSRAFSHSMRERARVRIGVRDCKLK
jgi:hypothetical protein